MSDKDPKALADKAPGSNKAVEPKSATPAAASQTQSAKPASVVAPAKTDAAPAKAAPAAEPKKPAVAAQPKKAAPVAVKAAPVAVKAARKIARKKPVPVPARAIPSTPIKKGPIVNDTMTKTAETMKTATNDAQNRATAMMGDLNARTKSAVERSTKMIEEMNDFGKGNIEALVESSKVAAKAAEQLGQQAAETARKNFETASQAMKSFASVKTPTEFFQLQSEYARNAFDAMIADTSKNSEAMLKLAGDVFQPISNRFSVAADKMKVAA